MSNNEQIEWADLTGVGLHIKTFYFRNVFGFRNDTIGCINLLIDTLPVVREDKARDAGLIPLIGQPIHNIYERVDVSRPSSLKMPSIEKPPNLFQVLTQDDVVLMPGKLMNKLGLPMNRYRKVSTNSREIDSLFHKLASPILNQIKLLLQSQFPYISNSEDIQIISSPFGYYLKDDISSIENVGVVEVLQTQGNLKDSATSEYLARKIISLYKDRPLSSSDIANIINFSNRKQPEFVKFSTFSQDFIEPIFPTSNHKTSSEDRFYFSEMIKRYWAADIQKIFFEVLLEDNYSQAQINQQLLSKNSSLSMLVPQTQSWLLDLCESDKNNPFYDHSSKSKLKSYRTPLFVSYQIARLLSVDGMHEPIDSEGMGTPSLLDMTSGFGNLWAFLSNCAITAFESNHNIYQHLKNVSHTFNMLHSENKFLPYIANIINENVLDTSLSSAAQADGYGYDYIIATPDFINVNNATAFPFVDAGGNYHFQTKTHRLDHHISMLGLQHLKPHGRMVFILDVDMPKSLTKVESWFYQYLYAYFEVDFIVEMDRSIYYGSGHHGNVRMHCVSGKRTAPKDSKELIERTEIVHSLKIPYVINDIQLSNIITYYSSKKYKEGRFDRLISKNLDNPLHLPKTFKQLLNDLKFVEVDSDKSMYVANSMLKNSISNLTTNEEYIGLEDKPSPTDTTSLINEAMENGLVEREVDDFVFAVATNKETANEEKEATKTLDDASKSNSVNYDELDGFLQDIINKSVDLGLGDKDKPIDPLAKITKEGKSYDEMFDEDTNTATSVTELDDGISDVSSEDAIDLDFSDLNDMMTADDGEDEQQDVPSLGDEPDVFSNEDPDFHLDLDEGGKDKVVSSKTDSPTNDFEDNWVKEVQEPPKNRMSNERMDLMINRTELSTDNLKEVAEKGLINQKKALEKQALADEATKTKPPSVDGTDTTTQPQPDEDTNSTQNNDEENNTDNSTLVADTLDLRPKPVAVDLKKMVLDTEASIKKLNSSQLSYVALEQPQNFGFIKQMSLTNKASGYVRRLISDTQLSLYRQIPKSTDIFSATSNIDAWFNHNLGIKFRGSKAIFDLIPDFAKHASVYYCHASPEQHMICDTSKRNIYFIAVIVTLFNLKNNKKVVLSYDSDTEIIELLTYLQSVAAVLHINYEKKANPLEIIYSIFSDIVSDVCNQDKEAIKSNIVIQPLNKCLKGLSRQEQADFNTLYVLISSDIFSLNKKLNKMHLSQLRQITLTTTDIFDINALPVPNKEQGANIVYDLLPYYFYDDSICIDKKLTTDKRFFYVLFERYLKKASKKGLLQYHNEPLTYGKLAVRQVKATQQEGLHSFIDAIHGILSHVNVMNNMTVKLGQHEMLFYREPINFLEDFMHITKYSLKCTTLISTLSDNYKHGRFSLLPTTHSYKPLICEYLLYTHHYDDYVQYYIDSNADVGQALLSAIEKQQQSIDGLNTLLPSAQSTGIALNDTGHQVVSTNHSDDDLINTDDATPVTRKTKLLGYPAPKLKEVLAFIAARSNFIYSVESQQLLDAVDLVKGDNEVLYKNKIEGIGRLISHIPNSDILAIPFEFISYKLASVGIFCEVVTSQPYRFDLHSINDELRIAVTSQKTNLFTFNSEVYKAATDAVIVDVSAGYCPYLGIAPMRYDRFEFKSDHFRQRSLVVSEFLPPKFLNELSYKLSVPDPKEHKISLSVTDYIDIDTVVVQSYGEASQLFVNTSLNASGFDVISKVNIDNYNHYLALVDIIRLPQGFKSNHFYGQNIVQPAINDFINHYYIALKSIAGMNSRSQKNVIKNLFDYIDFYTPQHHNNKSWLQMLFYTVHKLNAAPVYDGSVSYENIYPIKYKYNFTAINPPSVSRIISTYKAFIEDQYNTISTFTDSMKKSDYNLFFDRDKNPKFEYFNELTKPEQLAHIYCDAVKRHNLLAFKTVVFSNFGINIDRYSDVYFAVMEIGNEFIKELYDEVLRANKIVLGNATFIAKAINKLNDKSKNVSINAAMSDDNIDADVFLYGYNHTASPIRNNNEQLYILGFGSILPKIKPITGKSSQFSLILTGHLSCPVISNQHETLVFLDYKTLGKRWKDLSVKGRLMIGYDNNKFDPYYEPDNVPTEDAQNICSLFNSGFDSSHNIDADMRLTLVPEKDFNELKFEGNLDEDFATYDVLRFTNNTNYGFNHIINKSSNKN